MENPDRTVTEQHLRDAKAALGRAKKYMDKTEVTAAEHLLDIAYKAQGANGREVLTMLNDEELFEEVRNVADRVPSVRKNWDDDC